MFRSDAGEKCRKTGCRKAPEDNRAPRLESGGPEGASHRRVSFSGRRVGRSRPPSQRCSPSSETRPRLLYCTRRCQPLAADQASKPSHNLRLSEPLRPLSSPIWGSAAVLERCAHPLLPYHNLGSTLFWYSRAIGFFLLPRETLPMQSTRLQRFRRTALWLALDLVIASALLAFTAWADSSANRSTVPSSGCYCCCGPSKAAGGCAKMCDLPKNAGHHWAVTCSKPRAKTPTEAPGAGPHFPRPSHNERASN